jgi:phage FluMu gp28-like protein
MRVEGVLFSGGAKLDMATVLKERMQDRKLRIPAGDVVLRADLHAIRSQVGTTGQRRLVADSDTDGHADRFWAMALATGAARTSYQPYEYRAAGPSRTSIPGRMTDLPHHDDRTYRNPHRSPLGARIRGGI